MVSLGIGTLVLQEDLPDHWFQVIESLFRTPGLPAGAWVALTLRTRRPPRPEPTRRGHPHRRRRALRGRSGPTSTPIGTTPEIASHCVTALRRWDLRHKIQGRIASHCVTLRHSLAPQGVTARESGQRPGVAVAQAPGGRPLRWGRPAPRR